MAKKITEEGEQMDLIDVRPENLKEIDATARIYKKHLIARQKSLAKEVEEKEKILNLIRDSGLKPLKGGIIKYRHEDVEIDVVPQDLKLKVRVKEDKKVLEDE